jgi:hypothetical protein
LLPSTNVAPTLAQRRLTFPLLYFFLLISKASHYRPRKIKHNLNAVESSRSQIVTLKQGQNIKYLPYAFTEYGALMAHKSPITNMLGTP